MFVSVCHVLLFILAGIMCVVVAAFMFAIDQLTATGIIYGYSVLRGAIAGSVNQLGFTVA